MIPSVSDRIRIGRPDVRSFWRSERYLCLPWSLGDENIPFHENGDVRIRYEEAGSGFTILIVPGCEGASTNIRAR